MLTTLDYWKKKKYWVFYSITKNGKCVIRMADQSTVIYNGLKNTIVTTYLLLSVFLMNCFFIYKKDGFFHENLNKCYTQTNK